MAMIDGLPVTYPGSSGHNEVKEPSNNWVIISVKRIIDTPAYVKLIKNNPYWVRIVDADALVLKHQGVSIHNTD